ncbi:MAG: ion channel [Candidatus Eremiobacteraeota bacterium]|nr:ion channel [Candidatus Eremiobacteraeota bacterium]
MVDFSFVVIGILIVGIILFDIFASVVVPRPVRSSLLVSGLLRRYGWQLWRHFCIGIEAAGRREVFLSVFAPMVMVLSLLVWVIALMFGFGLIFLGFHDGLRPVPADLGAAMYYAGTSLLTIGYGDIVATHAATRLFSIAAGAAGLATVAVVLTFLFSLFASFQRRETFVIMLDARGGVPASGLVLLEAHANLDLIDDLPRLFEQGQAWCAEVLDTHLAYPVLCYFRSSHVGVSWLAALGAMLDAATLTVSSIENVPKGHATLLHSVGSHLTHDIAKYFRLLGAERDLVERSEFRAARERLRIAGFVLSDEEQAWVTFRKLRSEYASALNNMARYWAITPTQWIGDRSALDERHG